MNENLNLVEKLKNVPIGTKFYSAIYGMAILVLVDDKGSDSYPIHFRTLKSTGFCVTNEGKHVNLVEGECTLFPSKDQRDWDKWEFDPIPVGTPCMVRGGLTWKLRYYAGDYSCFELQETFGIKNHWKEIITISEFDFVNLCRKEK